MREYLLIIPARFEGPLEELQLVPLVETGDPLGDVIELGLAVGHVANVRPCYSSMHEEGSLMYEC